MRWAGGDQVATAVVDGVEPPVLKMPYAISRSAVNRVVEALYYRVLPRRDRAIQLVGGDGVQRYGGGGRLGAAWL